MSGPCSEGPRPGDVGGPCYGALHGEGGEGGEGGARLRQLRVPDGAMAGQVPGMRGVGLDRRGERLGALSPGLLLRADTSVAEALQAADRLCPQVLAVDSVQTLHAPQLDGVPGSVSQVRAVASRLVEWAKRTGTPTLLVGHVTKDGSIAGPRVLEHTVDTVLYFEGDRSHAYRLLRAQKNRFGSTNEIGVFEMGGSGLLEVRNPSALFLAER